MVDMRVTTPVNSVENDLWGLTSRLKLSKVLASKGGERLRSRNRRHTAPSAGGDGRRTR